MSIERCGSGDRRQLAAWLTMSLVVALLTACQRTPVDPQSVPPPPTPPMAQDTPPPDYPPELACKQIGGQTLLDVSLAASGLPVGISIARSSGVKTLDDSAVAAVRGWKFKAATLRGKPAPAKLQVPVTFTPPNPPPDGCDSYL